MSPRIIPALAGNTRMGGSGGRRGGDHPRSRGEYTLSGLFATRFRQDHPRSRGEYLTCFLVAMVNVRIIPALAGNTPVRSP